MTGPDLKDIRNALGDAVGKRLSTADMAKIVGLAPANGADTWRKWEDGAGPSGPVASLLSILAYASDAVDLPEQLTDAAEQLGPDRSGEAYFQWMMRAEILRRLS